MVDLSGGRPRRWAGVIGFAHRGYPGRAPENSVAGYRLALEAGAGGLEGDVWPSADGHAVLHHDGRFRDRGWQRIPGLPRSQVPFDTLADLYRCCGRDYQLSLDVKDPAALGPTLSAARAAGSLERLWLCHPDRRLVAEWRREAPMVGLVDSTRLALIPEGVAQRARWLAEARIDALNLPFPEWTAEAVTACHQFGIRAWAWHAHKERHLRQVLTLGVDAVFSDDVEMMVRVLEEPEPGQGPDPDEGPPDDEL